MIPLDDIDPLDGGCTEELDWVETGGRVETKVVRFRLNLGKELAHDKNPSLRETFRILSTYWTMWNPSTNVWGLKSCKYRLISVSDY